MKVLWGFLVFIIIFRLSAQTTADFDSVQTLLNKRQTVKAKSMLQKWIEDDSKQAQSHYYLGVVYLIEGDYEQSIEALEEAIELNGSDYRFYERLGDAYGLKAQKGGMIKAVFAIGDMRENWEKAIKLNPDLVSARERLFSYFSEAPGIAGGDKEKAFKLAQEVLTLKPASGHMLLARYYQKMEEQKEAEYEMMQAVKLDSLNINLINQIGYFYLSQDKPQKALTWMNKYVRLDPDNPNAWDSRGDCFVKMAKFDSALVMYDNALAKDKRFEPSLYNRAVSLQELGRSGEAREAFAHYLKLYPKGRYAKDAKEKRDK